MDIIGVERTIERILECSYSVKVGLKNTPFYDYFHQETEFTYIHSRDKGADLHRFIVDDKPLLDANVLNNELEYMINGIIVTHKLDISEEWHFQLSTIQPLISFEHIQMVKNILSILTQK